MRGSEESESFSGRIVCSPSRPIRLPERSASNRFDVPTKSATKREAGRS